MSGQKILAFFIAILPVASIYAFPILINNLGHAILLFIIFPLLFVSRKRKIINYGPYRSYIRYFFYLAIISVIVPILKGYNMALKEWVMMIEFVIIGYFLITDSQYGIFFIKIYKNLSLFFSVFLLFQLFVYYSTKIVISGFIPFLPLYDQLSEFESVIETARYVEASSLFTERAHFCQYVVPSVVLYLWDVGGSRRNRILKVVIIITAVFLSTSSNGIVAVSIILIVYFLKKFILRKNLLYILLGVVLLSSGAVFFAKSSFISSVTYGLFVAEEDQTESKAYARIYRGFLIYYSLPTEEKMLGCGWRDSESCLKKTNPEVHNLLYMKNFEYMNSVAQVLCYSGLVGLVFFSLFFYSLWKEMGDLARRLVVITVLTFMLTSSVLLTDLWFLYLALIFSLKYLYEKNSLHIKTY